jgi:hypothetical protein
MNDKTAISPRAKLMQQIHDELRKQFKDVPGAHQVGELMQDELDAALLAFKIAHNLNEATATELTQRWPEIIDFINGRALRAETIVALTALTRQYSVYEIVAILDSTQLMSFTLNVLVEEPDLQVAWLFSEQ